MVRASGVGDLFFAMRNTISVTLMPACFIFLAPQVPQPREQRRVWFADGILPNGEVADAAKLTMNGNSSAGTLAVSHDPVKPVTTSPLPAEVRKHEVTTR